jgi:signal transduction histidine kinase/CheY-like chemotaxis protein
MLRTLTHKVTLVGAVFLTVTAIAAALTLASTYAIEEVTNHLATGTTQRVASSLRFSASFSRALGEAQSFAQSGSEEEQEEAQLALEEARAQLGTLSELAAQEAGDNPELDAALVQLQHNRTELLDRAQQDIEALLLAVETHDAAVIAEMPETMEELEGQLDQLDADTDALLARDLNLSTGAVTTHIRRGIYSVAGLVGLVILLFLLAQIMLRRQIVRPITMVAQAASEVAGGDLDQTVQVTNTDEIGSLQQAFNTMVRSLREQRAALEQHATNLAQAATEAQEARAAVEQASELKSQFLANMSHELRTPLNAIINFARILSSGLRGPVNEGQLDYLDRVRQSGEHLLGLINDILDISKIEAGRMELFKEQVRVGELVQSVMATALGLTKGKPIELRQEIAPDLPIVEADRTRIRQILLNLLSNAAKFTDTGVITVQASRADEQLILSVSDTGIGIAPEHLDAIFEEFRQIDGGSDRRYEGTGLGLAICRRLVDLHGGRLWVESTPGVGSTFAFSLPIAPIAQPSATASPKAFTPHNPNGIPVLVIDDDPAAIEIVATYLARDGYAVHGVADSRQALEQAHRIKPAAIILDVLMPHKDGWEILTELKADADLREVPVILYTIVEEQKLGYYLGASAYLLKPVSEVELRATLDRLVASDATVMVIDDDPNAREIVTQQLAQAGPYRIISAGNGREGLERIAEQRPDLIILDLMMPEVDGFAVLEELARDPITRTIPVIVLTAKDLTAIERDALTQRVNGLLEKGMTNPEHLLRQVSDLLSQITEPMLSLVGKE